MYREREKTLGYELELRLTLHADGHSFFFNGCTTDPVLRALFNDIRFRKAMNYAMDRQEVNENVCLGLAEMPTSIMESAYSPEKANALLDEIGMTERDADGYRLSPDGRPVRILVEYNTQAAPSQLPRSCDLFAEHMKAVGIHAEPRGSESAVYSERAAAHEIQISAWYTSSPTDADALFTLTPGSLCWCPAWNWTKESGTPKPEDMPDEFVAYMRAIAERKQYVPRSPEDAALYDVIKAFYRDRYWALVSTTSVPRPIWINGKLGNTVRTGTSSGYFRAMEILYFKEP